MENPRSAYSILKLLPRVNADHRPTHGWRKYSRLASVLAITDEGASLTIEDVPAASASQAGAAIVVAPTDSDVEVEDVQPQTTVEHGGA